MCASSNVAATRSPSRIRTLVTDDEPLARELMSKFVRSDPGLELVGTAASGSETLAAVEDYTPQLILLDIQMPNLDGISVAEHLASRQPSPYIIFVTAHDEFALQAFEVSVRDYLVKPVSKRRFEAAILRAKRELRAQEPCADTTGPLIVRSGETLVSLNRSDVTWVEAANQYVVLHTANGDEHIVSQSLRRFARTAFASAFVRIHRSTLVNSAHLVAVQKNGGQYSVRLSDDSQHSIARSRRSLVPSLLAQVRDRPQ